MFAYDEIARVVSGFCPLIIYSICVVFRGDFFIFISHVCVVNKLF